MFNILQTSTNFLFDEEKKQTDKNQITLQKPPETYDEYLKFEGIEEWPLCLNFEEKLIFKELPCWQAENLKEEIRNRCEVNLSEFNEMKERYEEFDERLNKFSCDFYVNKNKKIGNSYVKQKYLQMKNKRLSVQLREEDLKAAKMSSKNKLRTIEEVVFPGFRDRELTELPSQLEVLQILEQVTESQNYNKGFSKLWRVLFFSQASIAIFHDTFWWVFLNEFQNNQSLQDKFFTRIAKNYIALFQSAHQDIRDKFLNEYPRCLAQSIFLALYRGFPDSKPQFTEKFARRLSDLTFEWFAGLNKNDSGVERWYWQKLLVDPEDRETKLELSSSKLSFLKLGSRKKDKTPENQLINLCSFGGKKNESRINFLSLDGKVVDEASSSHSHENKINENFEEEDNHIEFRKKKEKSTPLIESASFERVNFNTRGLTPLVSHHLYIEQLAREKVPETIMRATTIKPLSSNDKESYNLMDVLKESKKRVGQLKDVRKRNEEQNMKLASERKKQVKRCK